MARRAPSPEVRCAARAVAAFLEAGLPQDAASLELLCQALDEPDPARALAALGAALAAGQPSSETAPLLALVCSPGPEALRALEPALAQADLDTEGAARLAGEVAREVSGHGAGRPLTLLLPAGGRAALPLSAPDVEGFVRRLRPEATAPAELRGILARRYGAREQGGMAVDLAVMLRHSRLAWTPARMFFLTTLLERAGPGDRDAVRGLTAWAVGFLDLAGEAFAPRAALAWRRQALLAQLRMAGHQEEALSHGSYEVLMSQGLRLAHVHGPDVRAELAHLDRACELVLGLRGEELADVAQRGLGQALDADGLRRRLSGAGG